MGLVKSIFIYFNLNSSEANLKVQELLRKKGFYKKDVDGIFDTHTEEAIKKFQESHGLPVDGIVGPQTYYLLKRESRHGEI